jgi:outer membrane protein assembly factor BamD (BamD/ComL family)
MIRARTSRFHFAVAAVLTTTLAIPAAFSQTAPVNKAPAAGAAAVSGSAAATGGAGATGPTSPAAAGAANAQAAGAPSAQQAPAQGSTATVAPGSTLKLRKAAPKLPAPTAQQLKAYQLLVDESHEYERGAKDFRRTLTQIVRHHYEERRKRVLSALDREIKAEKLGLEDARNEAIARLEHFIEQYSGSNADQEATPDAMFRLAALYEERAREKSDSDIAVGLEPAIRLYRRIIREYPKYEEVAAVHYYLGHAFTDAARIDEGQQAWRALVCTNRYQVKDDPKDASKIELQPLVQDHEDKYWTDWYNRHPVPLDQAGAKSGRAAAALAVKGGAAVKKEVRLPGGELDELRYSDPYDGCQPLAQNTLPGDDPRYIAEIWWQIGNYHFDQLDPHGGPFNLNRAVAAFDHSMQFKKPPIFGVSMYKQAWAYFKQQRYHTAVDWFVKLLFYTDEQEAKTGDPGADFRSEAYTYIAGSLTYVDFEGPPPENPYIPRNDVLDTETDPLAAERKMSIAITRVQDPALIPQDKKWTVEIYKSLAQEFIEITQNRNAVAMLELTLSKFPMNRDAPVMQNKVAELYDQLARLAPENSAARAEYAAKALEARTKLAQYVGTTPWVDANKDDPEALSTAEQLVKGGLKRAAADHTNFARGYYEKALELNDEGEQRGLIEKAIAEYRLAETGWFAYIEQDPTSMDSYESRFWLADARYWVVVLQVALGRSPSGEEVRLAREAASTVRDSNEDDKYLQPSAYYVVTIAEKVLEDENRKFTQSNGQLGVEKRSEVRFSGDGEGRKVVRDNVPPQVLEAIKARDEYNDRIALDRDPQHNGLLYAFQSADLYFVYGQFDEARKRFRPLYDQYCGKNEWGYKAWEKLISMSNFEGNADESRKLAEGKSCAYNEESHKAEDAIRKPVKQGVAYLDARKLYEEAEKMPDGPARAKKWREAAAAYKVALDAAPDRDEAPEAAMNGAFAYKQVGEYDKAIEMYELFISRYGNEQTLAKLKNGDPKASPPVPANPKKYEDRVGYLKNAYDALAAAYVLFFNYPRAAETYDKISNNGNFKQADRREAARQALLLYASLGDRTGMTRARQRFMDLGASPKEMAEADFTVATADLKRWDPFSPDQGANATARRNAQRVMEDYYNANKNRDPAAQFVVQAAYWSARTRKAVVAGDTNKWWDTTISAFEKWKRLAPQEAGKSSALGSREAAMAAEGEFALVDEELVKKFDYESGLHRYRGTVVEVMNKYRADVVEAKKWDEKLQHIIDAYVAAEWTAAALARQGTVWDSVRTGLYNTRPPELKMFDAKQDALLKKAENSDNPDLQAKADEIRVSVQQGWRDAREKELAGADELMVDRYGKSIMVARRYSVSNPAVTRAIRRLAFFTDVIGEAKMKQYTASVKDLNYTEGMFLRMRPGQVVSPPPQAAPPPLPVGVP